MTALPVDDRDTALALWHELGLPEAARPTPEQRLTFLRRCPDSIALAYLQGAEDAADRALRCWEHDHDDQIDMYRAWTRRLLDQVAALEVDLDWWKAGNV